MNAQARKGLSPGFTRMLAIPVAVSLAATSLVMPSASYAQATQPAATAGAQHLYINILEGEGALNNIRQRDAREPVVQVTDENHKPVAGVALLFLIHDGDSGGTATFGTNSSSLGVTTDSQGIAHATGLQTSRQPGTFTITVTATLGALVVTAIIHQGNVLGALNPPPQESGPGASAAHHGPVHIGKTSLISTAIVAAAAAAIIGTIVATSNSTNNSTSVTLGTSTVGHP